MLLENIPTLFNQDRWIKDYVEKNRFVMLQNINAQLSNFFFIDLTAIPIKPINYREIFVKWLIIVNKKRLMNGEDIICNYEVIKACPLWSVIPMPFKQGTISSVTSTINKQPAKTLSSIGTRSTIKPQKTFRNGSINKSK
jgi:hypothetical protein